MLYADDGSSFLNLRFENDVKVYGTQTEDQWTAYYEAFENDVKVYGTQTDSDRCVNALPFENDVKVYGTQTCIS